MCECNTTREIDSKRVWNPVTLNVEFQIFHKCNDCGQIWEFSNVEVY
jgi:hypothetical protein